MYISKLHEHCQCSVAFLGEKGINLQPVHSREVTKNQTNHSTQVKCDEPVGLLASYKSIDLGLSDSKTAVSLPSHPTIRTVLRSLICGGTCSSCRQLHWESSPAVQPSGQPLDSAEVLLASLLLPPSSTKCFNSEKLVHNQLNRLPLYYLIICTELYFHFKSDVILTLVNS